MRMRIRFRFSFHAALAALCCCFPAHSASAAPMHCAAARTDVEKTICADRQLLAQDQAISSRLDGLTRRCAASRDLLVQGQKFWLRERSDCRNVEGVFDKPDGLRACLAARMDQRLRQLDGFGAGCDAAALAGTYRFVDVDYLLRYGERYVGKTVTVWGSMDLASCSAPGAAPTAAVLVGKDPLRDRLRVAFSAMPAQQREFLCATSPSAHWQGTVKHDSQGNYLYLTDVLGQALPSS